MRLREILHGIGLVNAEEITDVPITGIQADSRKVKPGNLFICLRGINVDGHDFISRAVLAGAAAVLCEFIPSDAPANTVFALCEDTRGALAYAAKNFYGDPHRLKLVGITGTKGKTSVTYFIQSILEHAGIKTGIIGSTGAFVGDDPIDIPYQTSSTPDIIELYKILAHIHESGASHAVMEATSHGLVQRRMEGIIFDAGVFTNITHDHLDYHKTFDNYIRAKALLFNQSRLGVINLDDPNALRMTENAVLPVKYFGISEATRKEGYFADDVELLPNGVRFNLRLGGKLRTFTMNTPGRFSVYNALASIATSYEMGVDPDAIVEGLGGARGVPGRFERIENNRDVCVIVDYAHAPDPLTNIITSVREFTRGRVITLIGCGGDRDRDKRPIMGEIAGSLSDFCVITSDNPRNEDPEAIIDQILPGLLKTGTQYIREADRRTAIETAITMAKPGDAVILAGKGHEPYQEFEKGRRVPFDDKTEARRVLGC